MSSPLVLAVWYIGLTVASCSCIGAAAVSVAQSPLDRTRDQLGISSAEDFSSSDLNVDHEVRLIEKALEPIWASLAKSQHGEVSPEQARVALKRYFGQHLGWRIASLEAPNDSVDSSAQSTSSSAAEDAHGRSMNITGVASFAKAMKDALLRMDQKRLVDTYEALELDMQAPLSKSDENSLVDAYVASMLLGPNFIKPDPDHLPFQAKAEQAYSGWADTQLWLRDVQRADERMNENARSPFKASGGKTFAEVERVVEKVQENFGRFQDTECRRLRDSLLDVQDADGDGLVRLSEFYRRGLEGFQFVEKAEYLQQLGALDTTGNDEPRVVVANYVLSEANCFSETAEFSVCCISECDSYLEHLGKQLAAPFASPERIANIMDDLLFAVDDSAVPLSAQLRSQLEDISRKHGGVVPLHSEALAGWLHAVFPSVCPRPFKAKAVGKPEMTEVLMRPEGMRKYIDYMQRRQERERSQYSLQKLIVQEDAVMEQWEELLFVPEALPDAAQEAANVIRQGFLILTALGLLFLAAIDSVRKYLGKESCFGYHVNFLCLAI